jgi:hypothetical protein
MAKNPAALLIDSNGNYVGIILDGSVYRMQAEAQIQTQAKGATPAAFPTSAAVDENIQALHVQVKGNATGQPDVYTTLVDSDGHLIGVVLDDTIYRLQADAKVAKGASALVHLDAIDTTAGRGRLKATLYSPDGDPVAFPTVSAAILNDFVKEPGGSDDLRVDGSVTPVTFTYNSHPTQDISIQEMKFTIVSNSITFGSDYFGSTSGPLPNGVCVQATVNDGTTVDLYTLKQNEDFVNFASPGGFTWVVSSKDLASSDYLVGGGLKLKAGTADKISVCVQDDIDSCAVYFKFYVKGNLLSG